MIDEEEFIKRLGGPVKQKEDKAKKHWKTLLKGNSKSNRQAGSKLNKARALGVEVIDEKEFVKRLKKD